MNKWGTWVWPMPRFFVAVVLGVCTVAGVVAGPAGDGWRTVQMRVTAYCACEQCCGKYSDGQTACMHRIEPGDVFVAADKKYDFGTEMIVPGYNSDRAVKVLDRGGAIKGNRLDVFFGSHGQAMEWGVRYLDVKVRGD